MKKRLLVVISMAIFLSFSHRTFAQQDILHNYSIHSKEQTESIVKRELTKDKVQRIAELYGIDRATIIGGYKFEKNEPTLRQRRSIDDYYIKDASHQEIGGNLKTTKTFTGPGEMEMTEKVSLSSTMSSEISGNLGISGVSMASKLGATWVEGQEYSGKYKVKVPKGKTYRLYLFPNYNLYTFQIYKKGFFKDTYQGTFEFKEPRGVTVIHQDITGWQ